MANRFLNNITINDEYTLPAADGTADQVLTTDGAGQLVFVDQDTIASGSAEVVEVPVKNVQGSGLTKGDPVYISGSVGASGRLEVQLADAGNSAKMPAVGLLKQDLANNGEGFAVITGKLRNLVTSPIDGVTPSEGDVIYVKSGGSTGAALTTTKPTGATNLIQNMGKVGRVSTSSDGTFVVSSILRSNDVPNLNTGKIWVGDGNTIESAVVHLDETNSRMGINTTSPSEALYVIGNVRASGNFIGTNAYWSSTFGNKGTDQGIRFEAPSTSLQTARVDADAFAINFGGTGGAGEVFRILEGGNVGIGTTSPTNPLTVVGSNSISIDDYIIHNGDTDTYFGFSSDGNVSFVNNAGNEMLVYDGGVRVYNTLRSNTEIQVDGTIIDNGGSTGTSGQVLSSTGSGVDWIDASGGGGASSLDDLSDVSIGLGNAAFINIPSGGIGSGTLIIGSGAGNSMTSGATNNIAIGLNAGASITSGDEHTIIGSGAGRYVVPGTGGNTLVGYDTGLGVSGSSTYTYTTAVGVDCLKALTTGNRNTVVGSESAINMTTGGSNIVMGNLSGNGLETRSYAVVIGYQAMQNADSGSTVAIGYQANNTASTTFGTGAVHIGYQAGRSSTRNRAVNIGYGAGYSATSGGGVVIGEFASYSNTSASNRVVIGAQAARFFTGSDATAIGAYALYSSGSGYGNTGVGANALRDNSSGSRNTAIGHDAGENITTGSNNTTLGANAGDALLTGSNNTIIGYTSAASSTSVSNEITLGNTSITSLRCNVTSITSLSDKRDKKNIEESSYGLNVIDKLKPVTFDWDARDGSKTDVKDLGFIAQDLQGIDDEHLKLVYAENPEKLEATYGRLIPVLVKAIQELKAEIELLKS